MLVLIFILSLNLGYADFSSIEVNSDEMAIDLGGFYLKSTDYDEDSDAAACSSTGSFPTNEIIYSADGVITIVFSMPEAIKMGYATFGEVGRNFFWRKEVSISGAYSISK